MSAHNHSKISLLTAYISIHDFDIIGLSETYLTPTIDVNDGNLKTPGYITYRVDHASDVKRGGVCIRYKTMLPLKVLSTNFFQECINFEVSMDEYHDLWMSINLRINFMTFWPTWKLIWMTPLIAILF